MRVLIVGNIAQNGWLLAKFLRSVGIDAYHVYDRSAPAHWLPEWEECLFHPRDIEQLDRQKQSKPGELWRARLLEPWTAPSWSVGISDCGEVGDPRWFEPLRRLAGGCDATILTGPWAAYGPHLGIPYITFEHATMRAVPDGEKAGKADCVALARAYREAAWNVITNADCKRAADVLGLTRYSFIPHPVDTERFRPLEIGANANAENDNSAAGRLVGERHGGGMAALRPGNLEQRSMEAATGDAGREAAGVRSGGSGDSGRGHQSAAHALRYALTHGHPTRRIFLAPARQATKYAGWGTKNNAVIFEAFRRYLDTGGKPAQLVAAAYGDSLAEMRTLVNRLRLQSYVTWYPLQPKRALLNYYRAADVVLDQFDTSVGSYGTCTVEALACGKPVITWISQELHKWTDVPTPPVVSVSDAENVAHALMLLTTESAQDQEAREWDTHHWLHTYHSRPVVTETYVRLLGELVK